MAHRDSLIAIDVGNSRTKFALFDAGGSRSGHSSLPRPLGSAAVLHAHELPWAEIRGWVETSQPRRVQGIVAGANPAGVKKVLEDWPSEEWLTPQVVSDASYLRLEIALEAPNQVGIDRLLNAVAANRIRRSQEALVIVDAGTAMTVDFVSADGAFQGGAILPGLELAARALHRYTALLPLISIEELTGETPHPLGRNTRDALKSGLFYSQLAAAKDFVDRFAARQNRVSTLLTGGGAGVLAPHLPYARREPHLALQGLAIVAQTMRDENGERE